MCVGFEGTLTVVRGEGPTRSGVLIVDGHAYEIGLAFVPGARPGDRLVAHTGQGVRIVHNRSGGAPRTDRKADGEPAGTPPDS